MDTISLIHSGLSNSIWLFLLALGIWGLYRALRGEGVDGNYLGAVAICQTVIVIQLILGVSLWLGGRYGTLTRGWMHILYGAFSLVFLPFVYFYWLRGDDSNRAQWVFTFSTLFMFGVILRFGSGI